MAFPLATLCRGGISRNAEFQKRVIADDKLGIVFRSTDCDPVHDVPASSLLVFKNWLKTYPTCSAAATKLTLNDNSYSSYFNFPILFREQWSLQ